MQATNTRTEKLALGQWAAGNSEIDPFSRIVVVITCMTFVVQGPRTFFPCLLLCVWEHLFSAT